MGTILVVDDEEEARSLLAEHFAGGGYTVLEAADGDDALRSVRRNRPDLVLLDVRLPGMDGVNVLRRIRREDPGIGVVMITGHGDDTVLHATLAAGALECFVKPLDLSRLGETVRTSIELFSSPAARRRLAMTVQPAGDATAVVLEGSLDSTDADWFRRVLDTLVGDGQARLLVDLSGVSYMDSAGLGALIAAMKQARAAGGDLRLCGLHGELLSIFTMTGLIQRISVHASRDEAIASWR